MGLNISFDKYINALGVVPKIQNDYKRFRKLYEQKLVIEQEYKQLLSDAKTADNAMKSLKKDVDFAYEQVKQKVASLSAIKPENPPKMKSVRDLTAAVQKFNEALQRVEHTGGTEEKPIADFCNAYHTVSGYISQCRSNQFSYESIKNSLDGGKQNALGEIEGAIEEQAEELRSLLGFTKDDEKAHAKLTSKEKSLYATGFRFPEKMAGGIKLGNATIEINAQEAAMFGDLYSEVECKGSKMSVPYVFPISSEGASHKSNIYIEYDEKKDIDVSEQVSIAVHQLILKIVSECPLGTVAIHSADLTEKTDARFVYINARLTGSVKKIKDRDISNLLLGNLCSQAISDKSDLLPMMQSEYKIASENLFNMLSGAEITHQLYTYYGLPYDIGEDACNRLKRTFGVDQGCGTVGVHNIIVVNSEDVRRANAIASQKESGRDTESAKAWLDLIRTVKQSSDCFEYIGGGSFALTNDGLKRKITVQLGDTHFSSIERYDVEERKLILTIEQCNVETGSPFVDIEGAKAFDRTGDFSAGEYADEEILKLTGRENIAVLFTDTTFTPDEKSRIMSSLTLGSLTALKPGKKRLCFLSSQHNAHVMNVMNGLEGTHEGIRYSLLEEGSSQSAQQRTEYWRDSIRSVSKILNEKKQTKGRNYDIYNLIDEDSTKYLRLVYEEYTDDGQRYDNTVRNSLIPDVIKLSRETNGSVQCVLEIDTSDPSSWQKFLADSEAFDLVLVAKNHTFVDSNNRKLKLSVLTNKDDAQLIAGNLLQRYIKDAITSPRYEEIGFGSEKAPADSIGSLIDIPVGRLDGNTFSMGFDSAGNGIIGYMVQGTTGSGKSSLLFSLIYNGAMKYSPEALQFYLLDFKDGTSFDEFRNRKNPIPHVRQLSIKNDMEDADAIFGNLEEEVLLRGRLFKKYGSIKNISDFNKGVASGRIAEPYMPRLVVIIDECQNAFYITDGSGTKVMNDSLVSRFENLTRVARSYGIHFIVATQKMESRLADKIGAQLSGRCSFKMNSVDDASALLSHSVASRVNNLPRYGAMLYSNDGGKTCTQVQVAYDYKEFAKYADLISHEYPYNAATFEIGNEEALRLPIRNLAPAEVENTKIRLPLAENCMREASVFVQLEQAQNQSILMIGENSKLSSNIIVSMLYNMSRLSPLPAKTTLYSYTMNEPVVNLARTVMGSKLEITNDAHTLFEEIYFEIEKRDEKRRTASEGASNRFQPWLIALDGIRKDIFEDSQPTVAPVARPAVNTGERRGLSLQRGSERASLSLSAKPTASTPAPERKAPDRAKIWQKITEMASEVGIYLCVNLTDPRSIPGSRDYFKSFKHLITFPCQAVRECVSQRMGITIPMESALGSKHVAFTSKLHSGAAVCYFVTDTESDSEIELASGPKVYKIKPYQFD